MPPSQTLPPGTPKTGVLLYLHGFLSSPQSRKARDTIAYCQRYQPVREILVPSLPWGPAAAIAMLRELLQTQDTSSLVLIGSSLGGYYASILAEEYGAPAVLINPAVRPWEYWQTYLGVHRHFYSDDKILVTEQHVRELRELDPGAPLRPENILLLVETGDETLDYTRAVASYGTSPQFVREGGNHSYVNYIADLPAIFEFLLSRID